MEDMKELIENYQSNTKQLEKLNKKLNQLLGYNTKITAAYGHNTGGSKGNVSSKVENHVIKIIECEKRIMEYKDKIYTVNKAERILNNKEKEVIDLIKIYRNKITRMAKILGEDKNYVINKRDAALKKMNEYRS